MRKDREYNDGFTHKGMRKILVDTLRDKGITDESVLDAINTVPRHFFLESAFEKIAYENRAFPISADQTISHPYTVAYQTQLLQIKKGDKVLRNWNWKYLSNYHSCCIGCSMGLYN
jgi:protein-L-isoaspartate(D-aspartate) O-methyltransferase